MGNDNFGQTENYCEYNQTIKILESETNEEFYFLKGDNTWYPNEFTINILSNCDFGDLNYNNSINITDVILMLEHVLGINTFTNTHQELLADLNQETSINVTDLIINVENILNN